MTYTQEIPALLWLAIFSLWGLGMLAAWATVGILNRRRFSRRKSR